MLPVFIDSDNALGSPFGDIDDAFAIAAAIKGGLPVEAIASVFGNSFEPWVNRNNVSLAKECGYAGRLLRGGATRWARNTEASRYLADLTHPVRILSIGPMTNIAGALARNEHLQDHVAEMIFVATNLSVRLPAFRFFDFNQSKDPRAMRRVLASGIPLTCVPCDVARNLRVTEKELQTIPGSLGQYLRRHAARWFRRSRLLKGVDSVPVWDLVAAVYLLKPSLFKVEETTVKLGRMGQALFGCEAGRPIRVVTHFESSLVWQTFKSLVDGG